MTHAPVGRRLGSSFELLPMGVAVMGAQSDVLRQVSWRDCCPWLVLFRTVRMAIGVQLLLVASVGAVLNTAGWRLASAWFLDQQDFQADPVLLADVEYFTAWPGQRRGPSLPAFARRQHEYTRWLDRAPAEPVLTVAYRFVEPVRRLFQVALSWRAFAFYLFGALWTVAAWGLLGALIARVAVVYVGRDQRIGLREAWGHAMRKWGSHLAAVTLPLLGVVLMAMPMAVLGWCMRWDGGLLLAGVIWVPVLVGGLLMMILLLGLLFGWPLMWGTIAAECSDAFDAISRAYAYTFQQPVRYLFYAVVGGLLGLAGWLVVWGASESVVHLSYWATGWGAGSARVVALANDVDSDVRGDKSEALGSGRPVAPGQRPAGRVWKVATTLVGLSVGLVRTMASAFAYSYFWSFVAVVYLLLRGDVDETEMDDIYLDDQTQAYGLPPLTKDEAGVPGVDDEAKGGESSEATSDGPPDST